MGRQAKGYALVLAAALLWGTVGIFVKMISSAGVSSASMASVRLLTGALLLLPMLAIGGTGVRSGIKISPRAAVPCALLGVFGLALSNCCYYESMGSVGMSTASVLLYTSPVFGCVLGRILYKESVGAVKLAAIAMNVLGCVLAVTDGDLHGMQFSSYGVGMGVLAGFLGALMAVFSRMATERANSMVVTFWSFVFGGAAMGVLSFPWNDLSAAASPGLVLAFVGFGLLPTAVAYILYMRGLSMGLETSKVPVVASFETVATVCVGIGLYAEPAGAAKVLGICLVILSIVAMNVPVESAFSRRLLAHVRLAYLFTPNEWWSEKEADMRRLEGQLGTVAEEEAAAGLLLADQWKNWQYLR